MCQWDFGLAVSYLAAVSGDFTRRKPHHSRVPSWLFKPLFSYPCKHLQWPSSKKQNVSNKMFVFTFFLICMSEFRMYKWVWSHNIQDISYPASWHRYHSVIHILAQVRVWKSCKLWNITYAILSRRSQDFFRSNTKCMNTIYGGKAELGMIR